MYSIPITKEAEGEVRVDRKWFLAGKFDSPISPSRVTPCGDALKIPYGEKEEGTEREAVV